MPSDKNMKNRKHFQIVLTDENSMIELKVVHVFLNTSYLFYFIIDLEFSLLIAPYRFTRSTRGHSRSQNDALCRTSMQ